MKNLALLLLFLCFSFNLFGQIKAVTENDKQVILNNDFTWEYVSSEAEPEKENLLVIETEDCDCPFSYYNNEIDEFTGARKMLLDPILIGRGYNRTKLQASAVRIDDLFGIQLFYLGDLGCMSKDRSYIIIKFLDGTTLKLMHKGKTDCRSIMSFWTDVTDDMELFMTKGIDKIRIRGSDSSDDIDISEKGYFITAFSCCMK